MSNTRRAKGDGPMRQERFASSVAFETGLKANLVAKRVALLERPEDRELIWFLQYMSHQEGGLNRLARTLCERYPERLATPAMRKLGNRPGQVYSAKQVKQVRAEIPDGEERFILKGELTGMEMLSGPGEPADDVERYGGEWGRKQAEYEAELNVAASRRPLSYPAEQFFSECRYAATDHLEQHLGEMCLNPELPIVDGSPWYFPELNATLRKLIKEWAISHSTGFAVTQVGRMIDEALDYCIETGETVLINGPPRIGKTFTVQHWCESRPGLVRYIQVPATNDDFSFYREIAMSLGVATSLKGKAVEMRSRVEDTLFLGGLMVVFDEAHYLWGQCHDRRVLPARINWLMTKLINKGVSVALVTTPQFFITQQAVEERTLWTSGQWIGRIDHCQNLPESLSRADLQAVARSLLPNGSSKSIELLVAYAEASAKYLAGIDALVTRASFIARRDGRSEASFADIKRAVEESVIPSDRALSDAVQSVGKRPRKRPVRVSAQPVQSDFNRSESTLPARQTRPGSEPLRSTRAGELVTEFAASD